MTIENNFSDMGSPDREDKFLFLTLSFFLTLLSFSTFLFLSVFQPLPPFHWFIESFNYKGKKEGMEGRREGERKEKEKIRMSVCRAG